MSCLLVFIIPRTSKECILFVYCITAAFKDPICKLNFESHSQLVKYLHSWILGWVCQHPYASVFDKW